MIYVLLVAGVFCTPITGPLVITEPGTYDFTCGGSVSAPGRSAVKIQSDDVVVVNLVVRDSYECVEAVGRKRLTFRGGLLERCQKIAIRLSGGAEDVVVENMRIRDSGNGVIAYSMTQTERYDRIGIRGNYFERMLGPLDGHAVGLQNTVGAVIEHNIVVDTVNDGIAVYWNNKASQQSGVRVSYNAVITSQPAISFRASNGAGNLRFDNVVSGNTLLSPVPLYLTGALTPSPYQWSVEAFDNFASGQVVIRSTGTWCPRVFVRGNIGAVYTGGCL